MTSFTAPPENSLRPQDDDFDSAAFRVASQLLPVEEERFEYKQYLDTSFFVVTVVAGGVWLTHRSDIDHVETLGINLFEANLIPLLLYFWSLLIGLGLRQRMDALRCCLCVIWILIAWSMIPGLWKADDIEESIAGQIFNVGLIFFFEKFFFLGKDDEEIRAELEERLAMAYRSSGRGLAMSYFYNFVLPQASFLTPNVDTRTPNVDTRIDLEISRGNFDEGTLIHPVLTIFVPRDLNGADLKSALRAIKPQGKLINEAITTHRPMFLYFLGHNAELKTCDIVFDIPTIISSCWDRKRYSDANAAPPAREEEPTFTAKVKAQAEKLWREVKGKPDFDNYAPPEIYQELLDFQNELHRLVMSHRETRHVVEIISIPTLRRRDGDDNTAELDTELLWNLALSAMRARNSDAVAEVHSERRGEMTSLIKS